MLLSISKVISCKRKKERKTERKKEILNEGKKKKIKNLIKEERVSVSVCVSVRVWGWKGENKSEFILTSVNFWLSRHSSGFQLPILGGQNYLSVLLVHSHVASSEIEKKTLVAACNSLRYIAAIL